MSAEQLLARDLMTEAVVTVPPDLPVESLARLIADRGISSAPVTSAEGRLLGIVTEADLLRRLASSGDERPGWLSAFFSGVDEQAGRYARTHGRRAQDVMTTEVVTVAPDATAGHCAQLMERHHIKRLPVVAQDGRILGVISRADLLRAVLEPPPTIATSAQERDARIRAALRHEMREQPWAHSLYAFADVRDGVVTLHGFARSDAVRRGLRAMAGRIDGVERVDDQLQDAPFLLPGEAV
jgi:CBS domain-containing protein